MRIRLTRSIVFFHFFAPRAREGVANKAAGCAIAAAPGMGRQSSLHCKTPRRPGVPADEDCPDGIALALALLAPAAARSGASGTLTISVYGFAQDAYKKLVYDPFEAKCGCKLGGRNRQ